MLKVVSVLAAFLFATPIQSSIAEVAARCPNCRAIAHCRNCNKPIEGKIVFRATAVAIARAECSQVLSLDVQRADEHKLPPIVQVDLSQCAIWAGIIGDTIDVALMELHDPRTTSYTLACRHW